MNESDEKNLIRALENLVLLDKMSWTMLNHLATLQQPDALSIFRAYFHRLLKEYAVEVIGVDNVHKYLINSTNDLIPMFYLAQHHGRKLVATYTNVLPRPALALVEQNSERSIVFTMDADQLGSFVNAIEHVKNPLLHSSTNADQRTVSSLVANHSIKLINFLEGKKEKCASNQLTPAEPVFLTPHAPNRPYTLD